MKVYLSISIILFITIAAYLDHPTLIQLDQNILHFFEQSRIASMNTFFKIITEAGSIKLLLPITLVLFMIFVFKRDYLEATMFILITLGGRWINFLAKEWFKRERPSVHQLVHAEGYSFPSGHALNAFILYMFILYLILNNKNISRKRQRLSAIGLIILVVIISMSRIYLGVHYLSDVIAGISLGGFLLILMIWMYEKVKMK